MDKGNLYQKANCGHYNDKHNQFLADVEEAFEMSKLSEDVRRCIHGMAWEAGHSGGYGDVIGHYGSLVRLASLATNAALGKCISLCKEWEANDSVVEALDEMKV